MNDDKKLNEDDYLKKHLSDIDTNSNTSSSYGEFENAGKEAIKTNELEFVNFDVKGLPCGKFYPPGTLFMVRPASVKEVQGYSMVDDNNFYDIVEKMNYMLQSCVRVKYPNGKIGSFLEVKDQDRIFLIFFIRELTFQQGNSLAIDVICDSCGTENKIELKRENFVFHKIDSLLDNYFNPSKSAYTFELKNGRTYDVCPPNIGLQKSFTEYIIEENNHKRKPNLAFLKIVPFLLPGRTSITYEGIQAKLKEFEEMDDASFQFLNSAVSKMKFGIKELSKKCIECGQEVRADMQFPNGASAIFVIHDAFEAYIKE